MALTRRRMDFLEVLRDLVSKTGQPVHYDRVGERLKVSKWTAYDMLNELMSDGLVRASYSTSESASRGRSQVLFEPTPSGLAVLNETANRANETGNKQAEAATGTNRVSATQDDRIKLASILERARALAESKSDLQEILAGLQDASPLVFCASLIAALVAEFKRRGLSLAMVEAVLSGGVEVETALPVLIGVMAGGLLVKGALKKVWNIDRLIARFAEEIQRMEESTKGMLAEFAQRVMILE